MLMMKRGFIPPFTHRSNRHARHGFTESEDSWCSDYSCISSYHTISHRLCCILRRWGRWCKLSPWEQFDERMSCRRYTREPKEESQLDICFLPRNEILWLVHRTQHIPKGMARASIEIKLRKDFEIIAQTSFFERFLFPISPGIIQIIRINGVARIKTTR